MTSPTTHALIVVAIAGLAGCSGGPTSDHRPPPDDSPISLAVTDRPGAAFEGRGGVTIMPGALAGHQPVVAPANAFVTYQEDADTAANDRRVLSMALDFHDSSMDLTLQLAELVHAGTPVSGPDSAEAVITMEPANIAGPWAYQGRRRAKRNGRAGEGAPVRVGADPRISARGGARPDLPPG